MQNLHLGDMLRAVVKTDDEIYSMACTVASVNKAAKTITASPLNGDADLVGVLLQSQDAKGLVVYPAVDSTVIVTFLNKNDAFVSMFAEVDTYSIATQDEDLKTLLEDLITAVGQITVMTSVGQSTVPVNLAALQQIKLRVGNLLS